METTVLPNSMISSFFRSTRNLSSVHSGSGGAVGPLESSSDTGRGESALRSLLEPGSDCCCKYPLKGSHWAAMTSQSTAARLSAAVRSDHSRGESASHRGHGLCVTYIDRRSIKWGQAKAERRPLFNMSQRKGGWKGSVTKVIELSSTKHHFFGPLCVSTWRPQNARGLCKIT